MLKIIKAVGILCIIAVTAGGLNRWYNTYWLGQLYETSGPMLAIIGGAAPVVGAIFAIWLCVQIVKLDPNSIR